MDFDTPVNDASDFNLGWVGAGRLTCFFSEPFNRDQGDFKRGDLKFVVEGDYMLGNLPLELVYKRDSMDTDGYERKWYANDFGVNYFFNKHKAKVQFVYRMESNVNGADGDDRNQFVMQWQFVF